MRAAVFALIFAMGASTGLARAQTPAPQQLEQYKPRIPMMAEHTSFVVEANDRGQVSRVRSGVRSKDPAYNTVTYGNVVQTYIRTYAGKAVAGVYRISYDYDPETKKVSRSVVMLRKGGVNPTALGMVTVMGDINRRNAEAVAKAIKKADAKAHPSAGGVPARTPLPLPTSP